MSAPWDRDDDLSLAAFYSAFPRAHRTSATEERTGLWADNIRSARQAAGLNQTELARLIGTTQSAVSRWENGSSGITDEKKVAVARVLGVRVGLLFPLEDVRSA